MSDSIVLASKSSELLDQFLISKEIGLRNELVLEYLYIVKNVAKNTRGLYANYATFDDIVNQGIITLIDCLERFDRSKNMEFEAYSYVRIRNATIDYIRKSDFLPRRVRQKAKQISQAFSELAHELMREPTDLELAQYLEMEVTELSKHYGEVSNSQLLSIEEITAFVSNDEGQDIESHYNDPKQIFDQKLTKEFLAEAIDSLAEREKIVISLYYYENLKLKEIAEVLEVSEARVSQMHSKIIEKLQAFMKDKKEE